MTKKQRPQIGWRISQEVKTAFENAAKLEHRDPGDQFEWLVERWMSGDLVSVGYIRDIFIKLGVQEKFLKSGKPHKEYGPGDHKRAKKGKGFGGGTEDAG